MLYYRYCSPRPSCFSLAKVPQISPSSTKPSVRPSPTEVIGFFALHRFISLRFWKQTVLRFSRIKQHHLEPVVQPSLFSPCQRPVLSLPEALGSHLPVSSHLPFPSSMYRSLRPSQVISLKNMESTLKFASANQAAPIENLGSFYKLPWLLSRPPKLLHLYLKESESNL
jgi:hypothetical protein